MSIHKTSCDLVLSLVVVCKIVIFSWTHWSKSSVYWVAAKFKKDTTLSLSLSLSSGANSVHGILPFSNFLVHFELYFSPFNGLHPDSSDLILASWSFVFWYGKGCTFSQYWKTTILCRSAEQIFDRDSYFTKTSLGFWSHFSELEIRCARL